jgi:hypothetical protein
MTWGGTLLVGFDGGTMPAAPAGAAAAPTTARADAVTAARAKSPRAMDADADGCRLTCSRPPSFRNGSARARYQSGLPGRMGLGTYSATGPP